ncbi:TPA: hypothetical protein QDC20_003733 [Burkholderia aenigmatica]|uniref:hypothetical protein n=1 Tax=Burkholderia sp. AU45251 TaxID=3059204 RepID=UPI00264E815E|nr:hypothetical protein [Burkholderia sp. AU45251]HDR9487428.1 hypothetical protein [Burkholderia aenigmatica]MDN7520708.1 hypothetical protein [Burkholderia sp. AU45251]HDR9518803.1 hypothetical protein [Burkholderia aenigmatica]HDR9595670.1 hypothetical protein [Burkholderia aenigmatica]HDR9602533.1 hypothetical protein [Burkholderia aenigmatica]
MGFGFGKRNQSTSNSTVDLTKNQHSKANDRIALDLALRRALAVLECCASHGAYIELNDAKVGWDYLKEKGLISIDLDAEWNESERILLAYYNAGVLASSDKERARHLVDVVETQLRAVRGEVVGVVDAVSALNLARLKYPSKSWIGNGIFGAVFGVMGGAIIGTVAGRFADDTTAVTNVVFVLVILGSILFARYSHQKSIVAADAKIAKAQAEVDRLVVRNLSPSAEGSSVAA